MNHAALTQKIVETLRSSKTAKMAKVVETGGWVELKLAHIGTAFANIFPVETAKAYGWNEVWLRIGSRVSYEASHEFRGSAEDVAKKLCALYKAPSKAVEDTANWLDAKLAETMDGLREPEMAAAFSLDEELVFKAMELLEIRGAYTNKGAEGWFKNV